MKLKKLLMINLIILKYFKRKYQNLIIKQKKKKLSKKFRIKQRNNNEF